MFGLPKVFFIITIFANCLIWSQSRYAQLKRPGAHLTSTGGLVTRAFFDVQPLGSNVSLAEKHVRLLVPLIRSSPPMNAT